MFLFIYFLKDQAPSGGVLLSLTTLWMKKNKQLSVTLAEPCESHSIFSTAILHTKGPKRISVLCQSRVTAMSYTLFGMKRWCLSFSDESV